MPNYDFRCKDCEIVSIEFRSYEDRDTAGTCSVCGSQTERTIATMPGVTRASFIDSTKTARARELSDLKQASKLEVEKANLPHNKRAEISKEIKRLTSTKG